MSNNTGAMTLGVGPETLDGYSMAAIRKTISQLKDHSFQFKPSRREYIPKVNGKLRPLGIASPRDKIVQQAMLMILEAIYEDSIFLNSSHGFRPNRGCHTAFQEVSSWKAIDWFIEGDIKSYFDTIDHTVLATLLNIRIKDRQFLDLYWKAVRAGYVEIKDNKKFDSLIGTPQGSVISPILANIYLHELDLLMHDKIKSAHESGPTSRPSKSYLKLHSSIHTKYRRLEKNGTLTSQDWANVKKWTRMRSQLPSSIGGPGYRLYYVRYADDFLIGINGTKTLAENLKSEINTFLSVTLKLTMSLNKTKITPATPTRLENNVIQEAVMFLGTEIKRIQSRTKNQPTITVKSKNFNTVVKRRIPATKLSLLIPIKKLVEKLAAQQFCTIKDYAQGQIKPMGKASWINLSLKDILTKYNSVMQGISNFYSFADNRARLQLIQYILLHSCAKLFGRKLNLNSRNVVFSKFKSNLQVKAPVSDAPNSKSKIYSFKLAKSFKATGKFLINPAEPLDTVYYKLRTRSKLDDESLCCICASNERVEMHHVKALKGKSGKFMDVMRAMNRKQIPVCFTCHRKIHAGLYSGISLKKIANCTNQKIS